MLEVADQKIASPRRFGEQLSVLVTDIDHVKKVNDTCGHDVGDMVIESLGEILRVSKRSGRNRSTAWSPSMNRSLPAA